MNGKHHTGIVTAAVMLLLLAILFWDKLSSMMSTASTPSESVTASIANVPQAPQSETLNAGNVGMFAPVPDNVPTIIPYNPGPVPVDLMALADQTSLMLDGTNPVFRSQARGKNL